MRIPRELYQIEQQITQRLPALRPAQAAGLALWIYGTALARSACINAVVVELAVFLPWATARQRLREWLKDGADKARPLVLVDRGLWSPSLWQHLNQRRLHPLVRIADGINVRPAGFKRSRTPAELVPKQGQAWVGQADVFGDEARQVGTLLSVWGKGHKERWVLLTDLPPRAVQHSWYGLRNSGGRRVTQVVVVTSETSSSSWSAEMPPPTITTC